MLGISMSENVSSVVKNSVFKRLTPEIIGSNNYYSRVNSRLPNDSAEISKKQVNKKEKISIVTLLTSLVAIGLGVVAVIKHKKTGKLTQELAQNAQKGKKESEELIKEARQKAEKLIADEVEKAQKASKDIISEASDNAESLIKKAKDEAKKVIEEAEEKAGEIIKNPKEAAKKIMFKAETEAKRVNEEAQQIADKKIKEAEAILKEAKIRLDEAKETLENSTIHMEKEKSLVADLGTSNTEQDLHLLKKKLRNVLKERVNKKQLDAFVKLVSEKNIADEIIEIGKLSYENGVRVNNFNALEQLAKKMNSTNKAEILKFAKCKNGKHYTNNAKHITDFYESISSNLYDEGQKQELKLLANLEKDGEYLYSLFSLNHLADKITLFDSLFLKMAKFTNKEGHYIYKPVIVNPMLVDTLKAKLESKDSYFINQYWEHLQKPELANDLYAYDKVISAIKKINK